MNRLDLTGRTAIVTGASRGIGLATAQAIAAAGGNVVLTSRSQESADAVAAQVAGNAVGVGAHAVDEDAAKRCVDLTIDRFGSLDILVNNAGTNPAFGPVIDRPEGRVRSGVVHQDVQAAEAIDGQVNAPLGRILVDRMRADSDRVAGYLRRDGVRGLLGSGREHDVSARRGDCLGSCQTDAPGGAGDDRGAAGQVQSVHVSPPSPSGWSRSR